MSTHFYAFGSICRGETDFSSDIDLLACISKPNPDIDPQKFSIYTYDRIRELWLEGNPFAWHLHLESRLIFSSDGSDFLRDLGKPSKYAKISEDCMKFHNLFLESYQSLLLSDNSVVFNLSCMFLAMRNFATCYSFNNDLPIFSRRSPLLIDRKLPVNNAIFDIFSRARILSTRGYGSPISGTDVMTAKSSAQIVLNWMQSLTSNGETL